MPPYHITLFLLWLGWFSTVRAQSPDSLRTSSGSLVAANPAGSFVIDTEAPVYDLSPALEILVEERAILSPEAVIEGRAAVVFQSYADGKILPRDGVYWGRILLHNRLDPGTGSAEWVLSFTSVWTQVVVFLPDSDQIRRLQSGAFLPLSRRDFNPISDENLIKLTLPPGAQQLVYFRAVSEIDEPPELAAPELQSLEKFLTELAGRKKADGLFTGFILMILVYSLILYFFQRDRAYLYYSGYLLALIVWWSFNQAELYGFLFPAFFDQHPQYINFFKLATYLGLFSYLAFILTFLDLRHLLPVWHRVFRLMIWIGIPLMLVDGILLWSTNFSLARADQLSVVYILSFVVLTYLFLWPLYRTRDKRGYFIILGMLAMGGGFLMTAIHRFSTSGFTLTYFQIGTFIEVTIFSLGLAYRSNQVRKEQQQAIFELEKSRLQKEKQEVEARQLRELNELKSRFYTNITHEFRTPLTVITGMAEHLGDKAVSRSELDQGLDLIRRNGRQLLRLINQLLKLAKADAGNLELKPIHSDIVQYLQYLTESFYSMAADKQIRLVFYSEADRLPMDYDEDFIQHIVYNLLANALKFTPKNGNIVFHVQEIRREGRPWLQMKVKDSGIGIAADQLPHIFDPFFQADHAAAETGAGTGIGLSLVRELVELMGGHIQVESSLQVGSTFEVQLPVRHTAADGPPPASASIGHQMDTLSEEAVPFSPDLPNPSHPHEDLPILLLIEDNPDVATYISTLLKKGYQIQYADNGRTGIELALAQVPDIIISDVMMPDKNGFEVCETLKADERTSHIPIILLTARATQGDRIEGLRYGADAYLTKPFHKEELLIRLEKLVDLRRQLRDRFSSYDPASASSPQDDQEAVFFEKITQVIAEHLGDADFGVSQLAEKLLMSQMQVYRKLKALCGKTPSQFIRRQRLLKGKELLQHTDLNISEIAYEVGFTDPNYFSRTFHQEFKRPPSDFRK